MTVHRCVQQRRPIPVRHPQWGHRGLAAGAGKCGRAPVANSRIAMTRDPGNSQWERISPHGQPCDRKNIDVFNGTATQPGLPGNFKDPGLPAGFLPRSNVQVLNRRLRHLRKRQIRSRGCFQYIWDLPRAVGTGGSLDQPWGLAIAPTSFGPLAGDLLVGNKGSGEISVFNLANNTALGTLNGTNGSPIVIQDLWALTTGNGTNAGSTQEIYFTAGVGGYRDGLLRYPALVRPRGERAVLGLISLGLRWSVALEQRRYRATA